MKKLVFAIFIAVITCLEIQAQQFKVVTSVESIVPNGIGRSRIINTLDEKDYRDYTLNIQGWSKLYI